MFHLICARAQLACGGILLLKLLMALGLRVLTTHQVVNDGNIDYEKNIERMRHLLTDSCRAELQDDVKKRRTAGELRDRVRGIYELMGRGFIDNPEYRVIQDSRNSWIVNLDLNADEIF